MCEIPEKNSEWGMGGKQEIEIGWKLAGGGKKVNSDDQIGQLAALRSRAQMGSKNL